MKQKLSSLINRATACTALFICGQALRLTCKACCSLIACVNRFNRVNSSSMTLTALSFSHPACNKCRPVNSPRLCRYSLCCDVGQLIQSVQPANINKTIIWFSIQASPLIQLEFPGFCLNNKLWKVILK